MPNVWRRRVAVATSTPVMAQPVVRGVHQTDDMLADAMLEGPEAWGTAVATIVAKMGNTIVQIALHWL